MFDDELGVEPKEFYTGSMEFEGKFYEECESIPGLRICQDEQISFQRIYEHNDGIVLESSQKGKHTLAHEPILLSNTSHMQARNNEALRLALMNIFDGTYDGYFKTSPK